MMNLAWSVEQIVSMKKSPLAGALGLAATGALLILGVTTSWLGGDSAAWGEVANILHPAAIHGRLDWPAGYVEAFKERISLYMAIAQMAALIVLGFTVFTLYCGAFV